MGEGRAPEDTEGLSRHAQFQYFENIGRPMEGHDQRRQAAVLRGTIAAIEAAHGAASGLPLPSPAQADVHS